MPEQFYEVARRIYVPGEPGVCIEVVPHPDGGQHLMLHSPNDASNDWFGGLNLGISKEFAILLARALTDAAGEV